MHIISPLNTQTQIIRKPLHVIITLRSQINKKLFLFWTSTLFTCKTITWMSYLVNNDGAANFVPLTVHTTPSCLPKTWGDVRFCGYLTGSCHLLLGIDGKGMYECWWCVTHRITRFWRYLNFFLWRNYPLWHALFSKLWNMFYACLLYTSDAADE